MDFSTFPRLALLAISDTIGRIDYDDADMEAAREAVRDAVEAAIAAANAARGADTSALLSPAPRAIRLDDLSPEVRTDAMRAVVLGADQMRYTSTGDIEFLAGGEPLDPRGIADTTVMHIAGDQEWSVGQQRAAETQGWAIVTRSNDRDLLIVRLHRETFANDEHAADHVAEGARGGHAFTADYTALCRAALALIEASAANSDDGDDDTPALPSEVGNRTDQQIVEQADHLAWRMATEVMGYELAGTVPMRDRADPRMKMCWQMACLAIEELQATDVTNALAGIGE